MSQHFDCGLSYIFTIQNVNNSEKKILHFALCDKSGPNLRTVSFKLYFTKCYFTCIRKDCTGLRDALQPFFVAGCGKCIGSRHRRCSRVVRRWSVTLNNTCTKVGRCVCLYLWD